MPKLRERLTDGIMRNLPVPDAGNALWYDPELKGFAGRVTHKAARAFVGVYRFGGAERRDTIGGFPEWSAKAAREVFKSWKRDVDLGVDPRGDPEPEPALLFEALAAEFLAHGRTKRGRALRPATKREYRRALLTYAEALHNKPIENIRRRDIAAVIQSAARERGEVTAMRTRAALSRFYTWAIANGHAEANVATGTEGFDAPKRERVLRDGELAALWAETAEPTDYNMIVRIMLWTGCRRAEAGSMRWSELADGVWTVPGSRVKNHRTLALPVPHQMRQALEARQRRLGRDHLFGGGSNGFQGWSQSKGRLDRRLGFGEAFDLHDIRRTVETRMAGLGIPKDHVNRVLNHAVGPITTTYDHHSYLPEKAAALQQWADDLERVVAQPARVTKVAWRKKS